MLFRMCGLFISYFRKWMLCRDRALWHPVAGSTPFLNALVFGWWHRTIHSSSSNVGPIHRLMSGNVVGLWKNVWFSELFGDFNLCARGVDQSFRTSSLFLKFFFKGIHFRGLPDPFYWLLLIVALVLKCYLFKEFLHIFIYFIKPCEQRTVLWCMNTHYSDNSVTNLHSVLFQVKEWIQDTFQQLDMEQGNVDEVRWSSLASTPIRNISQP
jgi:hypothetical protein